MVGKTKWKPIELVLPRKIGNQNQYHVPGRTAGISSAIENLKDVGAVVPITTPFNSPLRLVKKTDRS